MLDVRDPSHCNARAPERDQKGARSMRLKRGYTAGIQAHRTRASRWLSVYAVGALDQPVGKILNNKLNSNERLEVSSALRKLTETESRSSYLLFVMADAINAASSPMPNNSADFVL
jgi:hypothetical protein